MLAELYRFSKGLVQTATTVLRGDTTGALVTTMGHASYQEAVRQGQVYSLHTAAAGVTVAAANVVGAANIQPFVGIFNPAGSGVNAVIWRGVTTWNSGTPGAGGAVWATMVPPAGVTAASGTSPINQLTLSATGSSMRGYVNQAMTGIGTTVIQGFAGGPSAGALAANGAMTYVDWIDGLLIIPPGGAGGLCAALAGTSPIVSASMYWEEVPV